MQEENKNNPPRTDKRTTSTKKNMRFENDLIEKIDAVRSDQPFSEWVKDACWTKLDKIVKND
tara:strand:+ start:5482 stop:5667 length:186 start_codon:yes stop_codon:yes gene_type:complete